jgi:hypothetical protein
MSTLAMTKNNKLLGRNDDEVMLVASLIDKDCTPKGMAKNRQDGERQHSCSAYRTDGFATFFL